jgi:hypothetical protein
MRKLGDGRLEATIPDAVVRHPSLLNLVAQILCGSPATASTQSLILEAHPK